MKAKYILRGLGLGMIITAVVMGAYTRSAVADARVAVLKEYGIGEEAVLAETLVDVANSENNEDEKNEDENAVRASESEEAAESDVKESVTFATIPYNEELESEIHSVLDAAEAIEQGMSEETEPLSTPSVDGQGNTVTIEILRGDDSGTVARKLYNAGLVESAAEYDAFLMQHGYDKRLSTGTKIIDASDSWLDIAEKLTNK